MSIQLCIACSLTHCRSARVGAPEFTPAHEATYSVPSITGGRSPISPLQKSFAKVSSKLFSKNEYFLLDHLHFPLLLGMHHLFPCINRVLHLTSSVNIYDWPSHSPLPLADRQCEAERKIRNLPPITWLINGIARITKQVSFAPMPTHRMPKLSFSWSINSFSSHSAVNPS